MSVGHFGCNSMHTGKEKLFILLYLKARFQDAVDEYNHEHDLGDHGLTCKVFDPYNSGKDFAIFIMTPKNKRFREFSKTYAAYEEVHIKYQQGLKGKHLDRFIEKWNAKYGDYKEMLEKVIYEDNIHASTSETYSLLSPEQVAHFYGIEYPEDTDMTL